MTTNDIDAIRKLADAATEGPWIAHPDGLVWTEKPILGDPVSGSVLVEDAEFIAAARTLLPDCADEIEQLRDKIADADEVMRLVDEYALLRATAAKLATYPGLEKAAGQRDLEASLLRNKIRAAVTR